MSDATGSLSRLLGPCRAGPARWPGGHYSSAGTEWRPGPGGHKLEGLLKVEGTCKRRLLVQHWHWYLP